MVGLVPVWHGVEVFFKCIFVSLRAYLSCLRAVYASNDKSHRQGSALFK